MLSLLFIDSFDHYASAQLARKWSMYDPTLAGNGISSGGGRNGSQGYHIAPRVARGGLWKTFSPRSSWVFGVAYRPDGSNNFDTRLKIFTLVDGPNNSPQCDLSLLPDMTIAITRNGALVAGGTSAQALVPGTYYHIEMRATISKSVSANTCSVNVNGVEWLSVTAGESTQATSSSTANLASLGRSTIASAESATGDYDDFYLCDNAGTVNNTFLGDVMITPLYPTGAGNLTQWSPSSGSNWSNVAEHPPDDDTTYNQTGTAANADLFPLTQIVGTPPSIVGVQWNGHIRKNDASAYVLNRMIRSGSTNFAGTALITPNSTYFNYTEVIELDPNTAAAWTKATVNAMQAGLKLVSVV